MDETTRAIIERITKSSAAPQPLPGGYQGKVFYDCSQLTQAELSRLAAHALSGEEVPEYDIVIGMAYRGIAYAAAMASGKPLGILEAESGYTGFSPKNARVLLVDDIVFHGNRIHRGVERVTSLGGEVVACACIIDRTQGGGIPGLPLFSACQLV